MADPIIVFDHQVRDTIELYFRENPHERGIVARHHILGMRAWEVSFQESGEAFLPIGIVSVFAAKYARNIDMEMIQHSCAMTFYSILFVLPNSEDASAKWCCHLSDLIERIAREVHLQLCSRDLDDARANRNDEYDIGDLDDFDDKWRAKLPAKRKTKTRVTPIGSATKLNYPRPPSAPDLFMIDELVQGVPTKGETCAQDSEKISASPSPSPSPTSSTHSSSECVIADDYERADTHKKIEPLRDDVPEYPRYHHNARFCDPA